MYVILVGPDGQVVRYDGQAIPRGEALRAFLAHGWRPGSRPAAQSDGGSPAPAPHGRTDGRPIS
jgi:hypothetical protein